MYKNNELPCLQVVNRGAKERKQAVSQSSQVLNQFHNCENDSHNCEQYSATVYSSVNTVQRKAALIGLSKGPSSHRSSGLASTTCYKITTNTLCEYTQSRQPESDPVRNHVSEPPVDNAPSGEMTYKVSKRAKNSIRALQTKNKLEYYRGNRSFDRLVLITLTLPADQNHDDRYLKDRPLRAFLNRMGKDHDCVNWIWKAERQANGNLHFHVLVDTYIPWADVKWEWNTQLSYHGYIDAYEKTWRDWDRHGFQFSNQLAAQRMNYKKQLKAYHSRLKHGYRNPNTTDIHATRKVKNLESYFIKYVAKSDDKVDGKVWGHSASVREIKNYKAETNETLENLKEDIAKRANNPDDKQFTAFIDEYFAVYTGPVLELVRQHYPDLLNSMADHYLNTS